MNTKKNQQRKDLVIKMIKEIAALQSKVPKYTARKLDYLLKGFLQESLDFVRGVMYIDNSMREAKDVPTKIFWVQVVNIVRKYFDTSKKIPN